MMILILLLCLLLTGCTGLPTDTPQQVTTLSPPPTTAPIETAIDRPPPNTTPLPEKTDWETATVKAIWLTQFDLEPVYQQAARQRDREDFTQKARLIFQNIHQMGFNTVFLQLRPNADSMYPSKIYPQSGYVTGLYGRPADYDPVEILVELARQEGLSIHAWINPMRAMKKENVSLLKTDTALGQLAAAQQDALVLVENTWYLDPGWPQVRRLIVDGAREAMTRYGFDGLHMDDYFYPTTAPEFDRKSYEILGGGRDLDDFRRQNLNSLVRELYNAAHEAGGVFGVSPAGNIETVYHAHFADVYTWCGEPGYLDYICPQVYFGLAHETHDFVSVSQTFSKIIHNDSVSLLVGMTFGKALSLEDPYAGSGKEEWAENRDVLARSLATLADLPHIKGVSVFCYSYLRDPLTGQAVEKTRAEQENFFPNLQKWKIKNDNLPPRRGDH